jgi:hypothetical protein
VNDDDPAGLAHRRKKQGTGRSKKGKHETGEARQKTDKGGEKGDERRPWPPKKKAGGESSQYLLGGWPTPGLTGLGLGTSIGFGLINDVVGDDDESQTSSLDYLSDADARAVCPSNKPDNYGDARDVYVRLGVAYEDSGDDSSDFADAYIDGP